MTMDKNTNQKRRAELWPESPAAHGDDIEYACRLEFPDGLSNRLWFRFPARQRPLITERTDPFLVAVILQAMRRSRDLDCPRVGLGRPDLQPGRLPARVRRLHTPAPTLRSGSTPTGILEAPAAPPPHRAISAFSGGVDSAVSVNGHPTRSALPPKRPLCAALLMHGMDLPLDQPAAFARASASCLAVTNDAGIVLHTGATNARDLRLPWEGPGSGTAVAASLMFFQEGYTSGSCRPCTPTAAFIPTMGPTQ